MRIDLLSYTNEADVMLAFTKSVRQGEDISCAQMAELPAEELNDRLKYVFNTINSSWEFVDYTFLISDVTRAFTHQLVRHRAGTAFAQQAQRVVDMSGFGYLATGKCIGDFQYDQIMGMINTGYQDLLGKGCDPQDARGVLPTNIYTNILFKTNLRELSHIMGVRLCVRAQGEFQDVAKAIKIKVVEVHPYLEKVLRPYCAMHGVCQFPRFKACPVSQRFSWLVPNFDQLEEVNGYAAAIGTHDIQPNASQFDLKELK